MSRSVLGLLLLGSALSLAAARADDTDPEPPNRSAVKAGGLTVKADRDGALTATDSDGKRVWEYKCKGAQSRPQLIGGDRLLALYADALAAVDPRTGELVWELKLTDLTNQAWTMALKGGEVTLSTRGRREVVDARTGKVLKVVNMC
jgi:outer membrane protein assembly factor BamB